MAITRTHLLTNGSTTDAASFVTTSITPTANALVILDVVSSITGAQPPTVTGCGLTWVEEASVQIDGGFRRLTRFRAMGTPTAGALTIDFDGVTQASCLWSVSQFTGPEIDTSGTNGSGACRQSISSTGTAVATLTSTLDLEVATNVHFAAVMLDINSAVTVDADFTEHGDDGRNANTIRIQTASAAGQAAYTPTFASADVAIISSEIGEAAAVVAADTGTTPRNVYVIAGQSNAVGGAQLADLSAPYVGYVDAYPAVLLAQEVNCPTDFTLGAAEVSTVWGDLEPRTPGQRFGTELSAGRTLDARFRNVAIIKCATNGTNLYSHWDPETALSLYAYLTAFVDERMAELPKGSRIVGLFWIQGNGDASSSERAEDYAANLGWLIMRFRQAYGDQVNVVIDRMPEDGLTATDTVRAQQLIVAQRVTGVVRVDSSDLALTDSFHYTGDSLIILGDRMAAAIQPSYAASGTTYEFIRERQLELLRELVPTMLPEARFRLLESNEVDFAEWADAAAGPFRVFDIVHDFDLAPERYLDPATDHTVHGATVLVSYPQTRLYAGRLLDYIIDQDVRDIVRTLGNRAFGHYVTLGSGEHVATSTGTFRIDRDAARIVGIRLQLDYDRTMP